jgi:hypothetical protein
MITATSVQPITYEGQVDSPAFPWRFDVTTVMAQTAVGYIAANFLLILARVLLVPNPYNFLWVFVVPVLLFFGAAAGLIIGLFIWAGMELEGTRLNAPSRSLIGVVLMVLGWLALTLSFRWPLSPPELGFWVLAMVIAPGIGMGLVTGSRLRLWHELVRKGDRVGPVLGVFASLTGVLLRFTVPVLFMASAIALIGIVQAPDVQQIPLVWWALMAAHFTAASVLVFVRVKTDFLLPLAVIANAPIVAVLLKFPWLHYVVITYLALWGAFLVTRWRQTQAALSVLNEEFRYYLID